MNTTTEQVSKWMRQQLAKAHEFSDYGHITIEINQEKKHADWANVRFSVFLGAEHGKGVKDSTIEGCFNQITELSRRNTPQGRAEKMRAEAAELLAKAEQIESQAATL